MTATAPGVADEQSRAGKRCDHCGLPVPKGLVDPEAERQYCCAGCHVAYETINGCGLDEYYRLRANSADAADRASGAGKSYAAFDAEAFLSKHVQDTRAGYKSVEFRLEGVHCAACVWLVERLARVAPGVVESRLSLGSARARVAWDPSRTQLSQIATALDRLGYAPHPARDASARRIAAVEERGRLARMAVAGALAGNNMLIALALYAGVFDGIDPRFVQLFRWLSMAIGCVSLAWPGRVFFRGAWAALRTRTPNLDLPIALALGVGVGAGVVNAVLGRGEVYFDSLSVLVFLLLVGRYAQSRQQRRAEESVGLMLSLTPDSCHVVRDGRLVEEPIEAIAPGDEIEVRAGDLFPADGLVTRGESTVDRSLLTGESVPVPTRVGDAVCAGSQNLTATVRYAVSTVGDATRVGQLMRLVDEGLQAKPPIVQVADRIAGWFVLVVCLLATSNFIVWYFGEGLAPAIDSTVALLIVACPCALGLATPLTMAMALGRASRSGMLIKSASALERLARVGRNGCRGRLFLDKTGTLTRGELSVVDWRGGNRLKTLVAAIEEESNHPISRALVRAFGDPSAETPRLTDRVESHGGGVSGRCDAGRLLVGSPRFARQQAISIDPDLLAEVETGEARALTSLVVALDGRAEAVVWLSDEPDPHAAGALDWLRGRGWECEILSGDAEGPVQKIAAEVGVEPARAHSQVTPEEKLSRVERGRGKQPDGEVVVMVGDGVNDAAALAAADVGVAVQDGAEASLAAADVYLHNPGIASLVDLVKLSRQTMRVVKRNLFLSLAYNLFAVGLAAAGWITPLIAALLMPASSATVIASAIGGLSVGPAAKNRSHPS